jgi:hypothetical protein
MAELREVFEMTTKQMQPDQDSWKQQERRQRKTARNRRVGALVLAAAIGLAAIVAVLAARSDHDETTPADRSAAVNPADAEAVNVATGFLAASGAYDVDKAMTYMADDANLSDFIGAEGAFLPGSVKGLRLQFAWNEATHHKEIIDSCEASASGSDIHVLCPYHWQGLGSDSIGLGPYGGASHDFIVRDGKIVGTGSGDSFTTKKFSPQVWEPFARWVSLTYPKDVGVMYHDDTQTNFELTPKSIRLWGLHLGQYVKATQANGSA